MLVHFVCIERDKWGIDPILIDEETMYNLTHLSGMLSTPNLGVVNEKVCTQFLTALTYSVGPVTTVLTPCILGSDTEYIIQIFYK